MKKSEHPAFPVPINRDVNPVSLYKNGLTKREYFAGMAMQGMMSNTSITEMIAKHFPNNGHEYIAKESLFMADELLKHLEK